MPLEIHFRIDKFHDESSMADANIDALYAGSLRKENTIFLFQVILHFISGA